MDVQYVIAAADQSLEGGIGSYVQFIGPSVEDDDVQRLAQLGSLRGLVLDNTNVSDAGLVFLQGLTKLRRLYVRGTRVTADGICRLQKALPELTVLY